MMKQPQLSMITLVVSNLLAACVATTPSNQSATAVPTRAQAPALQSPHTLSPIVIRFGREEPSTAGTLTGLDFKRSDGNELPSSLEGWKLYWHWAGNNVLKPRLWPVVMRQNVGRTHKGLLTAENNAGAGGKFIDALVLCPPVSNPSPSECAIPQRYRMDVDSVHTSVRSSTKEFGNLKAIIDNHFFAYFQVVSEDEMKPALARISQKNIENATAAKQRDKRRAEEITQASAIEAERRNRQAQWLKNAKKGVTLGCGTTSFLMRGGEPITNVPFSCHFPGVGTRSINLSEMLNQGWRIENQTQTPAPSMDGGTGFAVSLVLRKI